MYYQANRFFPEDDQIINNTSRKKHIPVTIIHGLRDVICTPVLVWNLHKKLTNSVLNFMPEAGCLSSEHGIRQALLIAVEAWS